VEKPKLIYNYCIKENQMSDTLNDVLTMFGKGLSAGSISEELGINPSVVRSILVDAGKMEKQGRKLTTEGLTEEEVTQLLSEYTEGTVPPSQLITQYHITWNALYKLLDANNIPFREMRRDDKLARAVRLDRAVTMYQGGARLWEIENETGVRQPVLHSELHKRGVQLRRG
jgi:hypothetical protein